MAEPKFQWRRNIAENFHTLIGRVQKLVYLYVDSKGYSMPARSSKKTVKHKRAEKQVPPRKRVTQASRKFTIRLLAGILLISFLVYLPALKGEFVWDDYVYVQNNPIIFSFDLTQIFSKYVLGNYHPLTILVLSIEYYLFGFNVTGYHLVNVLIHLANTILVFRFVFLLCNKDTIALIAALLFGIHPLHVESVAWISELKDLLYCFFFLAACVMYLTYLNKRKTKYYLFAIILFLFSLLSKGMAASLPLVLILIDYFKANLNRKPILQKIPFFLLAVCFGLIAIAAQKSAASIQDIASYGFVQRIVFACYGFTMYLLKLIFPFHLSAIYPYPINMGQSLPGIYYLYLLVIAALVGSVIYSLRYSKKIFFGITFFAITIFLVLQLLPVGNNVMADRYSYVPSIGIFYLFGEALYFIKQKNQKTISYGVLAMFALFFSITTFSRCRVWQTGLNLWSDVIQKYPNAAAAHNNRALLLAATNKYEEALSDYNKALEVLPSYAEAYNNRGVLLMNSKKFAEALNDFNVAINLRPTYWRAYFNKGLLFMSTAQADSAIKNYDVAIRLNPSYDSYLNKGFVLHNQNRLDEALIEYNRAKDFQPTNPQVHYNIGLIMLAKQKYNEAIQSFSKAIEFNSGYVQAYYNRGMAENLSANKTAACNDFSAAEKLGFAPATEAIKTYCQ
jgi:protein O-mannosyl-transferase